MSSDQPFDPDQVPKYPVYQLFYEDLTDDAEAPDRVSRVELDGIRVEPAAGQGLRDAAIAAIAKKATDHQRAAVRVVVTNAEAQRWNMIVTAEGEAIDLSADHQAHASSAGRRKLLLIGAGGLLLLAAAASVSAVVAFTSNDSQPTEAQTEAETESPPAWEPPNAGAQVPIGLPEGYSSTATWVTPVADGSGVMELSDETLAFIDPDGRLQAIDAATAEPRWSAHDAPRSMDTVYETVWAGEPVIAEVTSAHLRMWPIPADSTAEPVQPHTVELSHSADVSFVGDAPLIDLGDYVVAADAGDGTLTEVEIPAGATALMVAEDAVISIDDTHLYRSPIHPSPTNTNEDEASDSAELDHHSAVDNDRPQSLWPLTAEVIAGVYEGEDDEPIMQLFTSDGERLLARYIDSAPTDQATALVDAEAETAVIGSVGLRWGEEPEIADLTPPRDPLLHQTTLWGTDRDGPAHLDMTDPDAEPEVYDAFSDDDPPPVLVTDEAAYVEAPRLDQTLLYRAEHRPRANNQHRAEQQSSTDPNPSGSDDEDHAKKDHAKKDHAKEGRES